VKIRSAVVALALLALAGSAQGGPGVPLPPTDRKPTWSPDASAIVFWSSEPPGTLRVMKPDGSGNSPIPVPGILDYAFSPDWYWIAFPSGGTGAPLVVMRPDGSQRHEIGAAAYAVPPSWAPDGKRLVFQGQTGIFVVNADGSDLHRIAPDGALPRWSPAGDRIAYLAPPYALPTIRAVSPDGSASTELLGTGGTQPEPFEWSPDGEHIAYVPPHTGGGPYYFGILDTRTGVSRVYPFGAQVSRFAWSPTRPERIAVDVQSLWLLDVASGNSRLLALSGGFPAWSPDGSQLAFSSGGECRNRVAVYRMDVASAGLPVRLTNDCRIAGTPGKDSLVGTRLFDLIIGLGGDDVLTSFDADYVGDSLEGDAGDDVLVGGGYQDVLDGGAGDDRLVGGADRDDLRGGAGKDVLLGGGGNDVIHARDGARDVVSCGTNRLKTTNPGRETDSVYADRVDAVAKDCELVVYAGVSPTASKTLLEITVVTNPGIPAEPRRKYVLRCGPAGGTLPNAARACTRLANLRDPFAPVPRTAACTQIYGGPQRATVVGTYDGRRVGTTFRRTDGCQIARWNRVAFLFPSP
jgi:Tol biopolymer transport system component